MLATKLQDKKNEEGFTLIELLVVVIIIGILAAIAIPAFLNQRSSAWTASAESDARNAAIAVETYYTQNDAYPAALPAEVQTSTNVTLAYTNNGDGTYEIVAEHSETALTPDATYDSALGGIQ